MSTTPTPLPSSVNVTINVTFAASVAQDINTHWLAQRSGSPGTLAAAMAATDTTLTLTPGAPTGFGFTTPAIGTTLLIDSEPMTVTAINGDTYTVTRAVGPLSGSPVAHEQGATVMQLLYPDPWSLIANESLRPWAVSIVNGLGAKSVTFGAVASGSIATA